MSVRIVNSSGTAKDMAFPSGWVFVSPKPLNIPDGKTGILSINCYGAADADVVCAYAESS